jgi:MFS family permease
MTDEPSDRYGRYALGVLTSVYVFNYIDRQILSILAESIKADLGVSDAQLGYLYGTVFAVFYSLFGIPLGRLADVWDRRKLLAIGLGFWSAMTALSAFARTFPQLALARVGVGVGEASANPAAHSMLSDYFPAARRATVMAVYSTGIYIGTGLGLGIGGLVVDRWGWRAAFLVAGLPGLLLALWVRTLREPSRGAREGTAVANAASPFARFVDELQAVVPPFTYFRLVSQGATTSMRAANVAVALAVCAAAFLLTRWLGNPAQWWSVAVGLYAAVSWGQSIALRDRPAFRLMFETPSMRNTALGLGFVSFSGYGYGFWTAPFFVRNHGLDLATAGLLVGGAAAAGGWLGVTLGGLLGDRWRRQTPTGRLRVGLLNAVLAIPICLMMLWASDLTVALCLAFVLNVVGSLWLGPGLSTVQDLVLPRMRGQASAAFLLVNALIGFALGPYVMGRLSVALGDLRIGVSLGLAGYAIGALLLVRAMRTFAADESSRHERARAAGELAA